MTTTNAEAAAPDGHSGGREVSRRWRAFQRPSAVPAPSKRGVVHSADSATNGTTSAVAAPDEGPARDRQVGPAAEPVGQGQPRRGHLNDARTERGGDPPPPPGPGAGRAGARPPRARPRTRPARRRGTRSPPASPGRRRRRIVAMDVHLVGDVGRDHQPDALSASTRTVFGPSTRPSSTSISISRVSGAVAISVGSVVGAEPVVDGEGDGARSGAVSSSRDAGRRTARPRPRRGGEHGPSGPDPSRSDHGTGSRARRGQRTCESNGHGFTAGVPLPEMTL